MALEMASGTTDQSFFVTDDCILSVQVLELKTTLLDVVQELHIRRDAETRYEEQINKLVLEKQELEWQKESIQHQITTLTNQHDEALDTVKKTFQDQIRSLDEDKGKRQLTAELREKEMTSLKEELKTLQLCKYSMEKKLSELEQKLELQTQSKDNHLKQLGEVEQRFETVSRQYTTLKQAHDRLQQNMEETMKTKKMLTTLNKSQESKINLLTQDVERSNRELIKARVSSTYQLREEVSSLRERERQIQQLQHRLQTEMQLNKKLQHENDAVHLEKQGVLNSLQHTQQLLHTQTVALSRSQAELLAQREEYQALKRQHELVQEEAKGKEEKFGRLKEECKNDNILWEKEKQVLQQQIQTKQEELASVKEAFEHLHEKHKQLSFAGLQGDIRHSLEQHGIVQGTDRACVLLPDCQPSADTHSKSLSSKEKIDPISATQCCTQGDHSTCSEPVPDEMIEPAGTQVISTHDFPSRRPSSSSVNTQPAPPDTSMANHLDLEENRQSCAKTDQSGLRQAGQAGTPLLPPSAKAGAKEECSDLEMSTQSNPDVSQAPDICEHSQPSASLNVDQLSEADNNSSRKDHSSGKDCSSISQCSEGLSLSESSSVYGAQNDPGASGKREGDGGGEVGVQQTLCPPEATHPQSLDKASDSQPVAPAVGSACPEPLSQTPAGQATSNQKASILHKVDESESECVASGPKTEQPNKFNCDKPVVVTAPTQVGNIDTNNTDIPQICPQTPVSPSQQSAESDSSQCLDPPQNDLTSLGLPSSNALCSHVTEAKDLHGQSVDCSPVTVQKARAVQWVNPEENVPAVTADAKYSPVSTNRSSPELSLSASSSVETDPPQVASDGEKHPGPVPAEASVTPPSPTASGGDNRSPSQGTEPRGRAQETRPHRSSFLWGDAPAKNPQPLMGLSAQVAGGSPGVAKGNTVCTVSAAAPGLAVSEHRSATPQWRSPEISSAFPAPIFQRDRLNRRANVKSTRGSNSSGTHPGHKREHQENWNAIKQSLNEMTTGMESRVSFPFSCPASGAVVAATSLSGGNGLQQDCPTSRSFTLPRGQSLRPTSQPAAEGQTQSPQAKLERAQDDIRAQIAMIEQFLSSEGESLSKKSKMEEKEDIKP